MAFAPSTLSAFEEQAGGLPPRLEQRFFGLLGPNGPLPLHLTEHARERLDPPRRPHVRALPRPVPPSARAALLPRVGRGAAHRAARPARRGPVRRVRRDRSPATPRRPTRERDAVSDHAKRVLRRTPGAEREERRGPRLDPGGLLRPAARGWSSSCWAGSSCRRTSARSWAAGRARASTLGSGLVIGARVARRPEPVPDRDGSHGPRPVRRTSCPAAGA